MAVRVELVHTGTELLTGARVNLHAQWLSERLTSMGYEVVRQTVVADAAGAICEAVAGALGRVRLVVVTGGLGPTSDDRTREEIAQLLGRRLVEDAQVLRRLEAFYAARNRVMPERARVQALVPEGAVVLENRWGTAPGLALEVSPEVRAGLGEGKGPVRADGTGWLVLLPGPTREMRPMFEERVVPLLAKVLPVEEEWASVVLRTVGLPESVVEARVAAVLEGGGGSGVEVGYCAHAGEVDVRLVARGPGARERVGRAEHRVRLELGQAVYGAGEVTLEAVVLEMLRARAETVAVAESCTGGCVAHRLTNVPGASASFVAGWVTYSNESKVRGLGVTPAALAAHGAVSAEVAKQMAEGARRMAGSTHGLAITGIAGPTGGSAEKPVGTVFLAYAGPGGTEVERRFHPMDRVAFKEVTATYALDLLRRALLRGAGTG
jgi:nicotinamide-nucleotide amidase